VLKSGIFDIRLEAMVSHFLEAGAQTDDRLPLDLRYQPWREWWPKNSTEEDNQSYPVNLQPWQKWRFNPDRPFEKPWYGWKMIWPKTYSEKPKRNSEIHVKQILTLITIKIPQIT
jgi:hypothetical protein